MSLSVLALRVATAVACAPGPNGANAGGCLEPVDWPDWQEYTAAFQSDDGRFIDKTAGGHSTSEGQSYGLFFALVANERARFEKVVTWTRDNLAQGDLAANLPAWKWGKDGEGQWGILDPNSASDSDLWIAYALLEAARLWNRPDYDQMARGLLDQVVAREVVTLEGLGAMLLPAPDGFRLDDTTWRLNPSYLPVQILRRFESAKVSGPWAEMIKGTVRMTQWFEPFGFAPDWLAWKQGEGFIVDPVKGELGSYDAIRTYLWAGMLPGDEPHREVLVKSLHGMITAYGSAQLIPEKVMTRTKTDGYGGAGPVGFMASVIPLASAAGKSDVAKDLLADVKAENMTGLYGDPATYYDQNLVLFGKGYAEERFSFAKDGSLQLEWRKGCK